MSQHHHPTHWLGVAAALSLALVAVEAAGQQSTNNLSPNAGAVFQGRPTMSGAQGGLGAQAGPAQGGIGLQGSDGAGRNLRRPGTVEEPVGPVAASACADLPRTSTGEQPLCLPEVRDERFERRLSNLGLESEKR